METKGDLMTNQLRRIHIIYFLSRMGRIEHPHLIRVHHLSRNGVYLRDVKRWLSDLRGKDMPDSFAWSYKRRYKAGYVWQDLVDEDLITPISDNEFVLKGSEISSVPLDACSCGEKKASTEKPDTIEDELQRSPDRKVELTPKISEIELDDKSSEPLDSERSPMTDESMKSNMSRPEKVENKSEKKNKKSTEKKKPPLTSSASSPKSKSYSSGASQVFRNILTCGAVDTNDSALTMINRVQRTSKNNPPETIGGSERIFGSDFNQQPHQQNSRKSSNGMKNSKNTNEKKKVSAPCKPIAEPICSQCGKRFKPEKLHSHMKSCRGMKSLNKSGGSGGGGASAATIVLEKTSSQRSTESSSKDVSSTYFLTR
ncbi:protein SOSEKI 1-like [Macadamia integrifolia]|uniref:protein SOSEKI 1-like n=1 Tax=Macadamia integrifolia TaxID=60698 RepID=UPI001C532C9E|nr:protein SOSEKI 1-like [Macadamia integrifolia]XP_042480533.1 protein SOSEKI 1-like [Macadamia integrifolia]